MPEATMAKQGTAPPRAGDTTPLTPPAHSGIQVLRDWPIEGIGDAFTRLDPGASTEEAIQELRHHALEAELPLPAGRGVGESFAWLLALLQRRRLVKDWGEFPAAVDWLSLHVPPGGAASFSLENKSTRKSGVTLKLFGASAGSGRGVTLSVKEDFLERKRCARLTQHVTVRVRTFDVGRGPDSPEVESAITGLRHVELRPWDTCPLCGRSPDDLDPFTYEPAGPGLDLRADDVGQKRSEVVQLSVNHRAEVELALPIPGLGGSGKVSLLAERQLELTSRSDVTFGPKSFCTPYRTAGAITDLPFWAVQ
jgi:hypothetical protein